MHPILEIAIGVALGMTVFVVIAWVIGMCVYVACSKNDCIATSRKVKKFKSVDQKIYVPENIPVPNSSEADIIPENNSEVIKNE